MEAFLYFLIFFAALTILLLTKVPVAIAMLVLGLLGGAIFIGPRALNQFPSIAYSQATSFVMMTAPLFILMGETVGASPVGDRLYRAGRIWAGRLPGALAMGTVMACTLFAAVSGSSVVTSATIGRMAVNEMKRQGYSKRLALGSVAAGGTLGIMIPPSIPMVVYAVVTETSVGALFIGGILPGIMVSALLCLSIILQVKRRPEIAPAVKERISIVDKLKVLPGVLPALALFVLVIGSIYAGIATPSESAALGAVGAIILAVVMRSLKGKVRLILNNAIRTTAMFLLLVICGLFVSFVLGRIGIPQGIATAIGELDVPGWAVIVVINLLLILVGCFMDPMSSLVVMVPILFPTVIALGYDPIWFGVILTLNLEIGAITPPVGLNLFVMKSTQPDASMKDIIAGSAMFLPALVIGLALLVIFPQIVMFLPNLMK